MDLTPLYQYIVTEMPSLEFITLIAHHLVVEVNLKNLFDNYTQLVHFDLQFTASKNKNVYFNRSSSRYKPKSDYARENDIYLTEM